MARGRTFKSAEIYVKASIPDASSFETVDYGCEELAGKGMGSPAELRRRRCVTPL
jgi:hypothetical protein